MRAELNKERRENFDRMWKRYHDGGIPGLPSQVYLDIGYLMGWITDADRAAWPDDIPAVAVLDGALQQINELQKYIRWMAQTAHQAYHHENAGAWNGDCPKDICASTRRQLADFGRVKL